MIVDEPSGDATSSEAPIRTYIPFISAGSPNQKLYSIISERDGMPEVTGEEFLAFFRLDVEISHLRTDEPIFPRLAVEDGDGNYIRVPLLDSSPSSISPGQLEQRVTLFINFEDLCSEISSKCGSFLANSPGSREETFNLYFFATNQIINVGEEVDTSTFSNGFYYRVRMSDRVPSGSLELTDLRRGDGRLEIEYRGGGSITRMTSEIRDQFIVVDYAPVGGGGQVNRTVGEALDLGANIVLIDDEFSSTDGRYSVRPLVNDQTYDIAVGLVNKFQFSSELSLSLEGTPAEIEALLTNQSCFILTAGFRGDHPVVSLFRNFRDTYLKPSLRGQLFNRAYYAFGPNVSSQVLKFDILAAYVRAMAKALSWFVRHLNFLSLMSALLIFSFVFIIGIRAVYQHYFQRSFSYGRS